MSSQVRFETPENIEVGYDVAGLGSRFAAWALDQFLVIAIVLILLILLSITGLVGDWLAEGFSDPEGDGTPDVTACVIGFLYLLLSLGSFFYFGLCELCMRGQTVGKRRLGLRVIQSDGFSLRPTSVLLRTVFRVVDQLPVLWIVPLFLDKQRRFGDVVAGTVVVVDRVTELGDLRARVLEKKTSEAAFRFGSSLSKLTEKDVDVIERIMQRLPDVDSYQKRKLLQSVVSPLAKRFEMELPDPNMNEQFLTELLAAHYEREYRRLG